jgi:hypothetical protein
VLSWFRSQEAGFATAATSGMTALLAPSHRVHRADHPEHAFPKLQNHPLAAAAEEPFLTTGWHNSATAPMQT